VTASSFFGACSRKRLAKTGNGGILRYLLRSISKQQTSAFKFRDISALFLTTLLLDQ
jgi:hypothetical protein